MEECLKNFDRLVLTALPEKTRAGETTLLFEINFGTNAAQ